MKTENRMGGSKKKGLGAYIPHSFLLIGLMVVGLMFVSPLSTFAEGVLDSYNYSQRNAGSDSGSGKTSGSGSSGTTKTGNTSTKSGYSSFGSGNTDSSGSDSSGNDSDDVGGTTNAVAYTSLSVSITTPSGNTAINADSITIVDKRSGQVSTFSSNNSQKTGVSITATKFSAGNGGIVIRGVSSPTGMDDIAYKNADGTYSRITYISNEDSNSSGSGSYSSDSGIIDSSVTIIDGSGTGSSSSSGSTSGGSSTGMGTVGTAVDSSLCATDNGSYQYQCVPSRCVSAGKGSSPDSCTASDYSAPMCSSGTQQGSSCHVCGSSGKGGGESCYDTPATSCASGYQLQCLTRTGTNAAAADLPLFISGITPITITATPAIVRLGGKSLIAWDGGNAASCTVSGKGLSSTAMKGSQTVTNIQGEESYTLSCMFTGDMTGVASTTVRIVPEWREI